MAVYKVPQDVEADDKLIGPFSFRQFVFILVMIGFLYLTYLFATIMPLLAIVPLPIAAFFGILGLWPRKDQPVEVYLAALIHFWTTPRKKIWNQEGHVEHVRINVPKKETPTYTDGLQSFQVKSRLHTLASTLDSRGWASKNLAGEQIPRFNQQEIYSDRLVMPQVAPSQTQAVTTSPEEDVLDVDNNPIGQNFQHMVDEANVHRQETIRQQFQEAATMSANGEQVDDAHLNFNPYPEMQQRVITPNPFEVAAAQQPIPQTSEEPAQTQASDSMPMDAILNLAASNDLNVSTLARQAEQALHSGDTIQLH